MHERSEEEKQAQRDAWDGIDRRRHGAAFDLLRKEFDQGQLRQVINVCAWCKAHISGRGEIVSHGICTVCRERFDGLLTHTEPRITEVREESHPVAFRSRACWIIMALTFLWLMAVGAVVGAVVRLVLRL